LCCFIQGIWLISGIVVNCLGGGLAPEMIGNPGLTGAEARVFTAQGNHFSVPVGIKGLLLAGLLAALLCPPFLPL